MLLACVRRGCAEFTGTALVLRFSPPLVSSVYFSNSRNFTYLYSHRGWLTEQFIGDFLWRSLSIGFGVAFSRSDSALLHCFRVQYITCGRFDMWHWHCRADAHTILVGILLSSRLIFTYA